MYPIETEQTEVRLKKHLKLCNWALWVASAVMITSFVFARFVATTEREVMLAGVVFLSAPTLLCVSVLGLFGPWLIRDTRRRIAKKNAQNKNHS